LRRVKISVLRTSIYLFIDHVHRVACVCLFYMRGSVCSMRRAQPRVRDDTSQIEHHPSVLHLWRSGLWNSGIPLSLYLQSSLSSRYPSMVHDDLSAVWPDVIENSRVIFRDDTDLGSCRAYAKPDVLREANYLYYVRYICIMSDVRMSIYRSNMYTGISMSYG